MRRSITFLTCFAALSLGACDGVVADELDDARKDTLARRAFAKTGLPRCLVPLPARADVHVVALYRGGEQVFAYEDRHQHPFRYADVAVAKTARPVVLYLSAYEPVLWRIKAGPGARIAAVILGGYYEPLIQGLPAGVPISRNFLRRRKGDRAYCQYDLRPLPPAVSDGNADAEKLAQRLHRLGTRHRMLYQNLRIGRKQRDRLAGMVAGVERVVEALEKKSASRRELQTTRAVHRTLSGRLDAISSSLDRWGAERKTVGVRIRRLRMLMRDKDGAAWPRRRRAHIVYLPGGRIRSLSQLPLVQAELSAHGKLPIVSVMGPKDLTDGAFEVSDAAAARYASSRADARQEYERLRPPELPVKPAGAERLAPPADKTKEDGLRFLVERGYLRPSTEAKRYFCARWEALRRASGGQKRRRRCHLLHAYTVLGPIAYPAKLCGGHLATFLLPKGVPAPTGNPCHSLLIDLTEPPCIGSGSECHRRYSEAARSRGRTPK